MIALLLLGACATPPTDSDAPPACATGVEVGDCAPDVGVVDRDGRATSLLDLRGDVTLFASEAMWCSSCRQMVVGFDDLYLDRREDGLAVVDVLIEDTRSAPADGNDAAEWADALALHYTVVGDPEREFFTTYGEGVNPFVFYVVDAHGVILWRATQETASTLDDVTAAVDAALGARE